MPADDIGEDEQGQTTGYGDVGPQPVFRAEMEDGQKGHQQEGGEKRPPSPYEASVETAAHQVAT